jgi:hypothetical protein
VADDEAELFDALFDGQVAESKTTKVDSTKDNREWCVSVEAKLDECGACCGGL